MTYMHSTIILFLFFISAENVFSQQNGRIEMGYLSQRWIQSEKESSGDTLVFRPEGHEKIAEAPLFLLYGGWTFFPEGQVHKHRWRKCGVESEPPFRPGAWKKRGNVLKIKIGKEQFIFQLVELNKEMLKAVEVKKG